MSDLQMPVNQPTRYLLPQVEVASSPVMSQRKKTHRTRQKGGREGLQPQVVLYSKSDCTSLPYYFQPFPIPTFKLSHTMPARPPPHPFSFIHPLPLSLHHLHLLNFEIFFQLSWEIKVSILFNHHTIILLLLLLFYYYIHLTCLIRPFTFIFSLCTSFLNKRT